MRSTLYTPRLSSARVRTILVHAASHHQCGRQKIISYLQGYYPLSLQKRKNLRRVLNRFYFKTCGRKFIFFWYQKINWFIPPSRCWSESTTIYNYLLKYVTRWKLIRSNEAGFVKYFCMRLNSFELPCSFIYRMIVMILLMSIFLSSSWRCHLFLFLWAAIKEDFSRRKSYILMINFIRFWL